MRVVVAPQGAQSKIGEVVAVSVGGLQDLRNLRGRLIRTGIAKAPVAGRVFLGTYGFTGDAQGDAKHHGGPDNAAYAYSADHYPLWRVEEGRAFAFGQFGENLTIAGVREDDVNIGDVFRVGTARVQVTQPRIPCSNLAAHIGDAKFPDRFLASRRNGFYLRVLQEGEVGAGDAFVREAVGPERMTVREAVDLLYGDGGPRARLEVLAKCAALSARWRPQAEQRLQRVAAE